MSDAIAQWLRAVVSKVQSGVRAKPDSMAQWLDCLPECWEPWGTEFNSMTGLIGVQFRDFGLGLLIASANTPWTLPIVDLFEQLCSLCQLRRNLIYCYCITPNITRSISLPYHHKANIILGVLIINHKMVSNHII